MNVQCVTLAALCAIAWSGIAQADDKELAQGIDDAAQDLTQNQWRDAQDELQKARADFEASKDENLRATYGFYNAVVNHQCADDPKVPAEQRAKARTQAIADYENYLAWNKNSGGALNNLAQLYAQDPAQQVRALKLYDLAVNLKDDRSGVYAINLAKLQSQMGQNDAALRSSRDALKKDPGNQAALELSLALLEKSGKTADIGEFVRELNGRGQVFRAIDVALREIGRLPANREPVLIALAEALANPTLANSPQEFSGSETAKRLSKNVDAADIGPGVRELLQLYRNPVGAGSFGWWRRDFNEMGEPHGWFRGQSFTDLARALGDRCRRTGEKGYGCAEAYYLFALEFASPHGEPNAFLALVQVYGNTNRRDRLAQIDDRYSREMFDAKMMAIGRHDKRKEYDFHLALGTMYSYLEKWEDPRWSPASAIYQLENAQRVAGEYNREHPASEQLQLPTQSVRQLSDAYIKTGKYEQGVKLRVDVAEKALDAGDKEGAKDVMGGKWDAAVPNTVDPALKKRMLDVSKRVDRRT